LHVNVSCVYQHRQGRRIYFLSGPKLHMSHDLARALKQSLRIRQFGSMKEADVDVGLEGIDVGKRRTAHAHSGLAIMQHFPNVITAMAHGLKPPSCRDTQSILVFIPPKLDGGMALCRAFESK